MNLSTLSGFLRELNLIIPLPALKEEVPTLKFMLLFMKETHFNQQSETQRSLCHGNPFGRFQMAFPLPCSIVNIFYLQIFKEITKQLTSISEGYYQLLSSLTSQFDQSYQLKVPDMSKSICSQVTTSTGHLQ